MHKGFWATLPTPIIGLAPMDGVTDVVFRSLVHKYSNPTLMITEFVSVEGMCVGNPEKLFIPFLFEESKRPILAQVFGSDPDAFYRAAIMVAHMGFDGIDINMGCPAKNISARGAGAGLIRTPNLAREIIKAVQQGVSDYTNGRGIDDINIPTKTKAYLHTHYPVGGTKLLPISIKTRIGYDEVVVESWIENLLSCEPANISIHGRTLEQMYSGRADWEAIGRGAALIHQTTTTVLGNGDVDSISDAHQKIAHYQVDGVLIGRATFGNPWLFSPQPVSPIDKLTVALEHSKLYEQWFGTEFFHPMRKHLSWYSHGFVGAKELRLALIKANNASDVETILQSFSNNHPIVLPS